jgi:hypothetical protein
MRNVCMTFSVLWNGDSSRAAFSFAIVALTYALNGPAPGRQTFRSRPSELCQTPTRLATPTWLVQRGLRRDRRLRCRITAHMFRLACTPPPPRPPRSSTSPPSSRSSPRSSAGSPISIDGGAERARTLLQLLQGRRAAPSARRAPGVRERGAALKRGRSRAGCGWQSSFLIARRSPGPPRRVTRAWAAPLEAAVGWRGRQPVGRATHQISARRRPARLSLPREAARQFEL